jgi:sulfite exporter TauE/SafE
MLVLISALLLGLMGSFHCAGMCGPIAIALPLHGNRLPQKIYGGVLYNLGRTLTYGVMGAVFGLLGQGVKMIGFQQKVSIIMGANPPQVVNVVKRMGRNRWIPAARIA